MLHFGADKTLAFWHNLLRLVVLLKVGIVHVQRLPLAAARRVGPPHIVPLLPEVARLGAPL